MKGLKTETKPAPKTDLEEQFNLTMSTKPARNSIEQMIHQEQIDRDEQ